MDSLTIEFAQHGFNISKGLKTTRQFTFGYSPQHHTQRVLPRPMTHGQSGTIHAESLMTHENGLMFGPKFVHVQERVRSRKCGRSFFRAFTPSVNKAVGRTRPLEGDVRTVKSLCGHETTVELQAFLLQHPDSYIDSRLTQDGNAPSLYLGKGVDTTHHHTRYARLDYQYGTRRCSSEMSTGFKTDIEGALFKERTVFGTNRTNSVYLGMRSSATSMKTFADDAVFVYYHRTHHGIGRSM